MMLLRYFHICKRRLRKCHPCSPWELSALVPSAQPLSGAIVTGRVVAAVLIACTGLSSFQFFEADEHHKHVEAELRSRLAALETEAAQHQAVIDGLTRKYMETIEKLQNDKAKLEVSSTALGG